MHHVYLAFYLTFQLFMSYSTSQLVKFFGGFHMHGAGDALIKKKMSTRILKIALLTCIPGVTFFFPYLMSILTNVDFKCLQA